MKAQVKEAQESVKNIQTKLSAAQTSHLDEVKRLRQEMQAEKTETAEEKLRIEARLQEETAKAKEGSSKVEQLVAQLELTNQKVDRLSLESTSQKSNVELRLKSQITQLENQLEEASRTNHSFKR